MTRLLLLLLGLIVITLAAISVTGGPARASRTSEIFFDDFGAGLRKWEISDPQAITIIDSGNAERGKVMQLSPSDARLHALIRGSEKWRGYRIEGEVLFPENSHNYLGFIYNYTETPQRVDLGSIYIKGNNSYIRVNPRRDWNPTRNLYEEYRTPLTGDDAIRIGQWQRFAAEVVGNVCHFYVGDMKTPKVTFDFFESDSGKAGFKPRVVGSPAWIDNIRATAIPELSYRGPRRPLGIEYEPERLVTHWSVLGPLTRTHKEAEVAEAPIRVSVSDGGTKHRWREFKTDPRGAVLTGRVTDFLGSKTVAYFATEIRVREGESAKLEFSSIDNLAVWVNGVFRGYGDRDQFAWHDFGKNPAHPPTAGSDSLAPGINHVLVRVRGGQYATGGFFARVVRAPTTTPSQ